MRTLFINALILTMDDANTICRSGYLLVENDRIVSLGEGAYPWSTDGITVMDLNGKAILPGFVNAHSHCAGSLFRGLLEDDPNGFYGYALPMEINLVPEDVYHLSVIGAYESMQAGITTANDIYHYADQVAKAFDHIGMRGIISQNIVDVDISRLRYDDYTRDAKKGEAFLADNIALIEEYHGKDNGRILCRVGPHATDTVSMELAEKCVDTAARYGIGLHMHTAQFVRENRVLSEQYGLTPVEYMERTGELGSQTMAAHCIYVNDSDIEKMAASGVHMLHCARGLALDADFPPTKKILAAGCDMVLGTDWITMDPWMNLRFAIGLNRNRAGVDPAEASALKMLRRFTIQASRALGLGDSIGSLEPGKKADLQIIEMDEPNLLPVYADPIPLIVYNTCRTNVSDVMVDGRFTIRDRRLTTLSHKDVLANAKRVCDRLYACRTS